MIKAKPAVLVIKETIAMSDMFGHGYIGYKQDVLANVVATKLEYRNAVGDNIRGGIFGAVGYYIAGERGSFVGASVDGVAMSFAGIGERSSVFPMRGNMIEPYRQYTIEGRPVEWVPTRRGMHPNTRAAVDLGNRVHYDVLNGEQE